MQSRRLGPDDVAPLGACREVSSTVVMSSLKAEKQNRQLVRLQKQEKKRKEKLTIRQNHSPWLARLRKRAVGMKR
jgi:hypothetical protein